MYFGLYNPAQLIEERGSDYFIATHPQPRAKAPSIIEIILGARHSLIGNWAEEAYHSGTDTFRILRRQLVLVNSPAAIKYVMVTANQIYERKSPQMRRAMESLLGDGLLISDGPTWAKRRPLVADIIHKRRIPEFAPTMENVAVAAADHWASLPPGTELDMSVEMAHLTAEIISRTVFGANLGTTEAMKVIEGFTTFQDSIDSFNLGYFLGANEGWPVMHGPERRRAVGLVHSVVEKVINEHLAGGGDESSMVALLLKRNQRNPDSQLDVAALRNEAATIFLAGHETTATTLTWAWYLIANSPWVEAAMHKEIDEVCGDRAPTMDDLPKLDWCRSIIQETLRLYPPIPVLPRQANTADKIGDIEVEKGALVIVVPWLLHRSTDLWDKPNHFMPERFLGDARIEPFTYVPFAVGPRICAGMNFALNESILTLAILAQRFRVLMKAGHTVEPVCRLTLRPAGGLPVTIEPRSRGPLQ